MAIIPVDDPAHAAAERELWAAVLALAVADALGHNGCVRYRRQGEVIYDSHLEAMRWFTEGDDDYRLVVTLAGLDPDAVREAVLCGRVPDPSIRPVRSAPTPRPAPTPAPCRPRDPRQWQPWRFRRQRPRLTDEQRRARQRERNRRDYLRRKAASAT